MSDYTRIISRLENLKVPPEDLKAFLFLIGSRIASRTKQNIVNQRIVDTGRLLNSISWKVTDEGDTIKLEVGSYNTVYAALHEFGMLYTPAMMRAMFASFKERGLQDRPGKGLMHNRYLPPRPYLSPAFHGETQSLAQQLRDFMRSRHG